jgi:hypothetical protein
MHHSVLSLACVSVRPRNAFTLVHLCKKWNKSYWIVSLFSKVLCYVWDVCRGDPGSGALGMCTRLRIRGDPGSGALGMCTRLRIRGDLGSGALGMCTRLRSRGDPGSGVLGMCTRLRSRVTQDLGH